MKDDANDYNKHAAEYAEIKKQAWRAEVELPSFSKAIGDVSGLKVLDMACGQGYHTRHLKQAGAAQVDGFDMSEVMIADAQAEEDKQPLGINYTVENVIDPGPQLDYDLAVSAWLLVYCETYKMLDDFCTGIARRIRPGGRFVTFLTNNEIYHTRHTDYQKYGFLMELPDATPREGSVIRWTIPLEMNPGYHIDNFYLGNEAYRVALQKAGFVDIQFHWLSIAEGSDR
ncbi:MAG: class I SAM-dependent methyltransferase, partial [Verrucomicrobiota bacterium]